MLAWERRLAKLAYSVDDVTRITPLSVRTIRKDIAAGKLRVYRKGRRLLIMRDALDAYLRGVLPEGPEPYDWELTEQPEEE